MGADVLFETGGVVWKGLVGVVLLRVVRQVNFVACWGVVDLVRRGRGKKLESMNWKAELGSWSK